MASTPKAGSIGARTDSAIAAGRWSAREKYYFCFVCLMLLPGIAAAQTRLDMALPEIADIDPGAGIAPFIKYIFVFGLGAIALLALAQMMIGGIEYLLAAGNVVKHEDAVDRIQQALIGLGVLLVSYLLLNTINPDLVNLKEPSLKPILFKGGTTQNISAKDFIEIEEDRTATDEALKKLSSQPAGTRIDTPLGFVQKINDTGEIRICKSLDCTYSTIKK